MEAKFNWYTTRKCGYYSRSEIEPSFGGVDVISQEIRAWAFDDGLSLEETCTFEVDEVGEGLRAFFFDLASSANGDFVLVTWNESQTLNENVAFVPGDALAGQARVSQTEIPEGSIAGYPTYFWFIPDLGIFSTIRFNQQLNGHQGLKRLLKGFLHGFSSHVVHGDSDNDDEVEIIGYSPGEGHPPASYLPRFESAPMRSPAFLDQLRQRRQEIIRVLRNAELEMQLPDDRNNVERLLGFIGMMNANIERQSTKVRVDLEYTPSERELNQLFEEAEALEEVWGDIGFKLRGDQQVLWVNRNLVKGTHDLNVTPNQSGVIDARSLSRILQRNRTRLLHEVNIR